MSGVSLMNILKPFRDLCSFLGLNRSSKYKRLKNHQFFILINYWINVEIDNIPVQNKIKKRVISKFLKIKFNIFEKNFLDYINTVDSNTNDVNIKKVFLDCISEYEEEAVRKYIPIIFIDKFREWHSCHIEIAFEALKSIGESCFYDSPYEKIAASLDILLFAFRLTIIDAEKTINDLNGELEQVLRGTVFDI